MATRKSNSKPKLAAAAPRDWRDDLQDDIQDRSQLIGFSADETMMMCADVLAFLCEFHMRKSANQLEEDVEAGEYHVLRVVQDALQRQSVVTTQRIPPKEVANG